MTDEQGYALCDVLFGIAIMGGFGFALYMRTLPTGALWFAAFAFVYGVVWTIYRAPKLLRRSISQRLRDGEFDAPPR